MSIEAVNKFLQKVSQDNQLQQELIEVMEFGQNDRFAITELGVKHGFDFTPKELWKQVEKRAASSKQIFTTIDTVSNTA